MNDTSHVRKYFKRCLQFIVVPLIFFFLARNLCSYFRELAEYSWDSDILYLAISFAVILCCAFLVALGWNFILRVLGQHIGSLQALRIYFLSELARYIPGNVWSVVGRIYVAEKEGVTKIVSTTSIAIQLLIQLIAALAVALLSLPFWNILEIEAACYYFFLLIPAGLVVLHPAVFGRMLNFFLTRFKKQSFTVRLRYPQIILLVLYWAVLWIMRGVGAYFLLRAVCPQPLPPLSLVIMVGVTTLSWALATLSFISPAGLGILEGITYVFVKTLLGLDPGTAAVFVLLFRLWNIMVELVCVVIVVVVNIIARGPDRKLQGARETEIPLQGRGE